MSQAQRESLHIAKVIELHISNMHLNAYLFARQIPKQYRYRSDAGSSIPVLIAAFKEGMTSIMQYKVVLSQRRHIARRLRAEIRRRARIR